MTFAAANGVMPLDMPESVLVRFSGKMQPFVTLRDLVHAIPYYALKKGLSTMEKKGKKNRLNGRIMEIKGLPDLKCEQAFELTDASAKRSTAGCTIKLNPEPIKEYLKSNIVFNPETQIGLSRLSRGGRGSNRSEQRVQCDGSLIGTVRFQIVLGLDQGSL